MTHESISLYIPARNAETTLRACVAAVQAQSRRPDDFFLLVDPRSHDATAAIALETGVRVVEQVGPTLGAARNQALLAARHRWVACCDSDVLVRPDWLEQLCARLDDGAAGIGGRTLERVRNPFDAWRSIHMPHHWGEHAFHNPFMLVSEVLFDREAVLAVGGYRDDLNYYEDSDLCQRLREGGYDLLYEPAAVAEHQRTDNLVGLLSLRWKYSEYRQRHLLDRYAGLLEKARVNREYALNTLARCLAFGREELAYISFVLYFHHLVMDFKSMLSRRPMIAPADRGWLEHRLLNVAIGAAHAVGAELCERVRSDMEPSCTPCPASGSPQMVPAWPAHLAAVAAAAAKFVAELPSEVRSILPASARHCHGDLAVGDVPRLQPPDRDALQARLDALPLHGFVDAALCRSVLEQWPDVRGCRLLGPIAAGEREAAQAAFSDPGAPVVGMAPHLEGLTDPPAILHSVDPQIACLVLCYQPPIRLIPGQDVITPADLASAAARAGWRIDRFDTLVGRIRLMLSRR